MQSIRSLMQLCLSFVSFSLMSCKGKECTGTILMGYTAQLYQGYIVWPVLLISGHLDKINQCNHVFDYIYNTCTMCTQKCKKHFCLQRTHRDHFCNLLSSWLLPPKRYATLGSWELKNQ